MWCLTLRLVYVKTSQEFILLFKLRLSHSSLSFGLETQQIQQWAFEIHKERGRERWSLEISPLFHSPKTEYNRALEWSFCLCREFQCGRLYGTNKQCTPIAAYCFSLPLSLLPFYSSLMLLVYNLLFYSEEKKTFLFEFTWDL
jgi:hypothetical protein